MGARHSVWDMFRQGNVVGSYSENLPNRSQVLGFGAANGMVEELNLGAGLRMDLAIRSNIDGIGKMIDSEYVDGVWVIIRRPNVDSMCDEWTIEIGESESLCSFRLICINLCNFTVLRVLWIRPLDL